MVDFPRQHRLTVPAAPLVGGLIGAFTALAFLVMPTSFLESLAIDSGIAAVLAAAEPPLGFTARLALVFLCGGGVALLSWFAAFLLLGTRSVVLRHGVVSHDRAPVLRRADAHPDAPARAPLRALTDLGTPFLEVRAPVHLSVEPEGTIAAVAPVAEPFVVVDEPPAERDLPADLDQPLAAFDPMAIPVEPLAWEPAPRALVDTIVPVEPEPMPAPAITLFDEPVGMTPALRDENRALKSSATLHALLDRLERAAPRPVPSAAYERRAVAR